MFQQLGPLEIGLIVVVVLIVFGAGKLPEVGGAIGKSIREFRKAIRGEYDEDTKAGSAKKTTKTRGSKTKEEKQG